MVDYVDMFVTNEILHEIQAEDRVKEAIALINFNFQRVTF